MWGGEQRGQCLAVGRLPEGHLRHAALADETPNLEAEADEHSETMGTVMGFTFLYLKLFLFIILFHPPNKRVE